MARITETVEVLRRTDGLPIAKGKVVKVSDDQSVVWLRITHRATFDGAQLIDARLLPITEEEPLMFCYDLPTWIRRVA